MFGKKMIKFLEFETHCDERGSLVALEAHKNIPFEIKRVYYLFNNGSETARGQHAHKDLKQVYVALSGGCKVRLNDGQREEVVTLNRPNVGMLFNQLVWRELFDFTPDCVLMVLVDDFYKEEDYIRNYEEFLDFKKQNLIS